MPRCEPYPTVVDAGIEGGVVCQVNTRAVACTDNSDCSCDETCRKVCDTCELTCGIYACDNDDQCQTLSDGFYSNCNMNYALYTKCE